MRQGLKIGALAGWMLLLAGTLLAGVTVELRAAASLSGEYVRLGEVADLKGDRRQAAQAGKLFLGMTPSRGESRRISREMIRNRLRETGLHRGVILRGANAVIVRRAVNQEAGAAQDSPAAKQQTMSPDRVRGLVIEAIRRQVGKLFRGRDVDTEVRVVALEGEMPATATAITLEKIMFGRLPGRATVRLAVRDGTGRTVDYMIAKVEAAATGEVVMLRRPLPKGQALRAADIILARRTLHPGSSVLPPDPKKLAARVAARSLRAMVPLRQGDLETPAAVRKGKPVLVDSRRGAFRIQARAVALEDGKVGDLISVRNASSRRPYLVRVVGVNLVELAYSQRRW